MSVPIRVLIAEDEAHLGLLLQQFLIGRGHAVTLVDDGRAALDALATDAFDVALLDVQMPGADGLAVLREVRGWPLPPQVVVMTGNGTVDTALAALQFGAYDYVAKPYRMAEVDLLVNRASERHALERRVAAWDAAAAADEWLTEYPPLLALLARVDAAPIGAALVIGEPGTGRSALARRVHRARGAPAPFVTLDGARVDPTSLARACAAARGGTLHVRRIELLHADMQRLLADDRRAETGLVVTTAYALDRLDLTPVLRRALADVQLEVPPLRDRGGDIALLAHVFARRASGVPATVLSTAALDRLRAHRWPGNVTELRLVIDGAVSRARHGLIHPADLLLDAI